MRSWRDTQNIKMTMETIGAASCCGEVHSDQLYFEADLFSKRYICEGEDDEVPEVHHDS